MKRFSYSNGINLKSNTQYINTRNNEVSPVLYGKRQLSTTTIKGPLISIIVPVYNVEKFIGKCLESILAQTYQNIELIIIDDGSIDYGPDIVEKFSRHDNRIRLIRQENKGVSEARNLGLDAARGAYIMFVDGDDYIEPNTLEVAYQQITNAGADILLFNCDVTYYIKYQRHTDSPMNILSFNGYFENVPLEFFDEFPSVWGKLFKNNDKLPRFNKNLKKSGDYAFIFEYYLKNPKITTLNGIYYHYLQHSKSITKNEDLLGESYITQSAAYVSNLDTFRKAKPFIQNHIMDKYAQSLINEVLIFFENKKWPRGYRKAIRRFLTEHCNSAMFSLNSYNELNHLYFGQLFPFLRKIYHTEIKDGIQTTTILGINFKKTVTLKEIEEFYIKALKKNQHKYEHDTYLLSDSLRDNAECIDAYSLFLYMRSKGIKAYYMLLKSNPLYKRLMEEENLENIIVIPQNAKEMCILGYIYETLLHTKAIISSFGGIFVNWKFVVDNPYWQYIFLQHGQIFFRETIFYTGYMLPKRYNKFLISSKMEEKMFKKYGFFDEDLIKCGLPRWDLLPLKSEKKKKILMMFTWRHTKEEEFDKSQYKRKILAILNSKRFEEYLKKEKVELYFAVHHALLSNQKIDFKTNYKHVVPIEHISEYIKECSLLITDCSSVAFDFMFQNKPILFYQLDKTDSVLSRVDKEDLATISFKKYLIGNVFYSWDKIFEKLQYYVRRNFTLEKELKEDYSKFFFIKKNIRKHLIAEIEKACEENKK